MKYAGAERRVKKKSGLERRATVAGERERMSERERRKEKRREREREGSGDGEDDGDGSFLPWSELFAVALGTSPRAEGGNKTNGNARR